MSSEASTALTRTDHAAPVAVVALVLLTSDIPRAFGGISDAGQAEPASVPYLLFSGAAYLVLGTLAAPNLKQVLAVFRRCVPLLLLVGLALCSALWSPDPAFTLRRSMHLAATMTVGPLLVARLGPRRSLTVVLQTAAVLVILSLVVALVFPSFGVHNETDPENAQHAGLWRGILSHKNTLGQLAAFSFVSWSLLADAAIRIRALIGAASLICLVFSGSAGGIAIAFLLTATCLFVRLLLPLPPPLRASALLFGAVLVLPLIFYLESVIQFSFEIIGREPTLTGRTNLWAVTVWGMQNYIIFGSGYAAGFREFALQSYSVLGWIPTSAHNQYLELAFGLGAVGLTLFLYLLLQFGLSAYRMALRKDSSDQRTRFVPILAFVFTLALGSYESTALVGREFATIILATAYAAARYRVALNEERVS